MPYYIDMYHKNIYIYILKEEHNLISRIHLSSHVHCLEHEHDGDKSVDAFIIIKLRETKLR